ncbi:MAG: hydrogenase maturation protease [Anaerolineales bacterium]|jgi:hydrogenase maturation protease|nr:hydrogenase maturation protease [Anaerolineales bacterium]
MKTIVIGLGNPILGDDGVGWRVAEEIAKVTAGRPQVEIDCASLGGLSLMERLTGYERVILIDAIFTGKKPLGSVTTFALDSLPDLTAGHSASAHDTSLRTALNVGRSMNLPLPEDDQVLVVAIEAQKVYDFSQELSPAVSAAVPLAIEATLELLRSNQEGE